MSWVSPITWSTGQLVTAANLNEQIRDNMGALRTGGLAITSQATGDVITASSSSQLTRVAPSTSGYVMTSNGAGVAPSFQTLPVTASSTTTFTNKRITMRVSSEASSATPTINTDNVDAHDITALAAAITSFTTNLSGTPTNFQKLIVRIKDNGTARAIAWGASFEAVGVALPTTTVISKRLTVGFLYDTTTSKWGCVAAVQEA